MIARVRKLLAGVGGAELPESVERHEDHRKAVQFMKGLAAKEGVEYGWLKDYAKALWEDRSRTFAQLDEKADSIIKYLGGGTGIFVLGVLAKVDASNAYLALWTVPAVVCAVASLLFAALVRKPRFSPNLPAIDSAVGYAEEGKTEAQGQALFLGQWHLACEDLRLTNEAKAWWLEWATWFYFAALALLALPVVVAALRPPPHA